jgi:hypothetical protein
VQMGGDVKLAVRLFGGVAIWQRSTERMRTLLGRDYADVDLVAHRRESRDLRDLLEAAGYVPERTFNAAHGASRLLYHAADGSFHIDVFLDRFTMSHELDFGSRLELEPMTLTAADLLLAKLQVAEVNRKDLTDAAMLLIDHELSDADGPGRLNAGYVSEVCAADWGLFTTAGAGVGPARGRARPDGRGGRRAERAQRPAARAHGTGSQVAVVEAARQDRPAQALV